jgi:hypothetical protein
VLVGGWWAQETVIAVGVVKPIKTRHRPLSQLLMSQMKKLKSAVSAVGRFGKQRSV